MDLVVVFKLIVALITEKKFFLSWPVLENLFTKSQSSIAPFNFCQC